MKRALGVVLGLCVVACDAPNPAGPTQTVAAPVVKDATLPSTPPSIPPQQPNAVFKVHPLQGGYPLTVHFNMCASSDVAPWVDLRYNVDFGDGNSDQGFCRFTHVYTKPAQYTATVCVSDRIASHEPGVCQQFKIGAYCLLEVHFPQLTPVSTPGGLLCVGAVNIGPGTCDANSVHITDAIQDFVAPIPSTIPAFLPVYFDAQFQGTGGDYSGITYGQPDANCRIAMHHTAPPS